MMTGTLNMADLATQLESVKNTLTIGLEYIGKVLE